MGEILSELAGIGETALSVLGTGIGASPVATVTDVIGATQDTAQSVVDLAAGAVGFGPDDPAAQLAVQQELKPDALGMQGFGGGNGRFAKRTIVQTLDRARGVIVSFQILNGAPHIMNSDITAAKRVFRQVSKLTQKLPRKTVKESATKKIVNAVQANVMAQLTCGVKPPCS